MRKYFRIRQTWARRIVGVILGVTGLFLLFIVVAPLPDPLFNAPYSTTLRAKNGQLLSACIAKDQQWRFPALDSLPDKFSVAIRIFEDRRFFEHPGVDPFALLRAVRDNIKYGRIVSGGSTLTMQTVRIAYHNKPRTYWQKITEIFAAIKLDLIMSKNEILLSYANHAPFGGNIVGINAASWRYYGRPVYSLSWAESAALAILPNDPAAIFPGKNEALFREKRNRLLNRLQAEGYINKDELFLAKEEPLPGQIKSLPDKAYHLLHTAMEEGMEGTDIQSTLDPLLQDRATQLVNSYSSKQAGNEINNAAVLVIEISTGKVKAYVGNSESSGDHGQFVDIIQSRRSPGSLLKPFLYAAALDDGQFLPTALIPDVPLFYHGFAPQNFDRQFRGAVHADQALASSLNVPFVHILLDYGYEKFHAKLKKMGMLSLDQPAGHYGLSMILVGGETTLWELTGMYAGMVRAFQNYLKRPYKKGYTNNDYRENSFLQKPSPTPVLQSQGYLKASSIGFALRAMQQLHRPEEESGWKNFNSTKRIAWKTGTSYGFRDAWAIGINDEYVVGVWLGNADGEGRPGLTGIKAAAPLLFSLFRYLPGQANFNEKMGVDVQVCLESGMRAGPFCMHTITETLPAEMTDGNRCNLHQLVHLDKDSTFRVNSSCYQLDQMITKSWFSLPPVEAWYYRKYHPGYRPLPPYRDGCMGVSSTHAFGLIYPHPQAKVIIPREQDGQWGEVIFEAAHDDPQAEIFWHLDNDYLGKTVHLHQMGIQAVAGKHLLTLTDNKGREVQQVFEVQ